MRVRGNCPRARPGRCSTALNVWLAAVVFLGTATTLSAAGTEAPIRVRYRTIEAVYLDAGREAGLAEGDRLVVVRQGAVVAELEVVFVADHSASCRILSERQTVTEGDEARVLGSSGAEPVEPEGAAGGGAEDGGVPVGAVAPPADSEPAGSVLGEPARAYEPAVGRPASRERSTGPSAMRIRGSLTLDWESLVDDSGGERYEVDELTGRLSLRVRNIGGLPYDLTVRMRTQENRRLSALSDPRTERRDRFYELSLAYVPVEGRLSYEVGRLGAGSFSGLGYLDGALGQYAITPSFKVGGFFGAAAQVESLGFESTGQKYGLFTRFASPRESDSRRRYDVVLAGVREIGELDVSREYLSLQSRYSSGSRWSFFQWAEVDLNSGWRKELAGTTTQLSNLVLTVIARLTPGSRFTLSYNRFEQYRTEDTRSIPERLFNDLQRQGLRASLQLGKPRGLNVTLNAGLRDQEGADQKTTSYGLGVRHPDIASWGLSLGLNLLAFDNPTSDGYVATLRASKSLSGGHLVHLDLGDRLSRDRLFDGAADRSTQWARLGVWLELPRRLFANAEIEVTQGDDLEGQRVNVGLGYRF